jgi:hypothetical protein
VHFDRDNCRLAQKIVEKLDAVSDMLPACQIRQNCRWWQQEGKAACQRCPQVVTDSFNKVRSQKFVKAVTFVNS